MNRRRCVQILSSGAFANIAAQGAPSKLTLRDVRQAESRILPDIKSVELTRTWSGAHCRSQLGNRGTQAVRIDEVVLFSLPHSMPADTKLYGDSFQMLSQTGGTLARPVDYAYSELKHYKIPQPADATVVTGLLTLTPPGRDPVVMSFTSCRRFNGRFYLRTGSIEVVLDTEGLMIAPGETWDLEEFTFLTGATRPKMLDAAAARINGNHKPLKFPGPPAGWCSWYCVGPKVTSQQVLDNLDVISKDIPGLKYVQIDDGYQPAMGDWLDTGAAFGGDVKGVLKEIRERGFEPAIWVAPFIAEAGSKVFQQHPGWFMKGADGQPLPSEPGDVPRMAPWTVVRAPRHQA